MKNSACLLLVIGLCVAAAPVPKKNDDAKNLLGKWKPTAVEMGGMKAPPDADELKVVLEFAKDKVIVHDPDGDKKTAGYKLDPTKKPPQIDITPENGEEKVVGIYELKGDSLKFCFTGDGGERPKKFATTKGSKEVLFVFKRTK